MTIAEEFLKVIQQGMERRRLLSAYPGLVKAEGLSTAELRVLWDSIDDSGSLETADPKVPGETVHFVLNQKGDGAYCAV